MARDRRFRRLHHHVSLPARRARRFHRARSAGAAAPRPVPARVRRQDVAREPRPAAPAEPVFLTGVPSELPSPAIKPTTTAEDVHRMNRILEIPPEKLTPE